MSNVVKVKLADIVLDPTMQTRELDLQTVSDYRENLRAGAKFPPLKLEKGTNRLIAGWHRFYASKGEYGPDYLGDCIYEEYKTERDAFEQAVRDNVTHGRRLSTWDRKVIQLRMEKLGASDEEISNLLGVTIGRLEKWGDLRVRVVGNCDGKPTEREMPLKHDFKHLAKQTITEERYQHHVDYGTGLPALRHASALRHLINDGGIDAEDEETMSEIKTLYAILGKFLDKHATVAV